MSVCRCHSVKWLRHSIDLSTDPTDPNLSNTIDAINDLELYCRIIVPIAKRYVLCIESSSTGLRY